MNENSIISLTTALRSVSARSSQHEVTPGSGQWTVLADATTGASYTMVQLANLQTAHTVGAKTDRAEFGPGTPAQIASLELALKTAHAEYRSFEKIRDSGDWYLVATSGKKYTVAEIQALEAAHGLTARTTRAEFV